MRSGPIVGTDRYFRKLYREYGDRVRCPVCDSRPCRRRCPIGFTDEWEIAALTELLADSDPKPKGDKI